MPKWKTTADVAIIGGGIMGVCTAYYLAKRGAKDAVLLERNMLAQASTGLSVGGIRQQFSEPANILLSQETLRVFKNIKEELNADIKFYQEGYLFLLLSSIRRQRPYASSYDFFTYFFFFILSFSLTQSWIFLTSRACPFL